MKPYNMSMYANKDDLIDDMRIDIQKIEDCLKWCLENEKECHGTKYEMDATSDNWAKIRSEISVILLIH